VNKFQYFFFSAFTIAGSATLDRKLFNLFGRFPLRGSLTYSIEGINQFDVQETKDLDPRFDEGFLQIAVLLRVFRWTCGIMRSLPRARICLDIF